MKRGLYHSPLWQRGHPLWGRSSVVGRSVRFRRSPPRAPLCCSDLRGNETASRASAKLRHFLQRKGNFLKIFGRWQNREISALVFVVAHPVGKHCCPLAGVPAFAAAGHRDVSSACVWRKLVGFGFGLEMAGVCFRTASIMAHILGWGQGFIGASITGRPRRADSPAIGPYHVGRRVSCTTPVHFASHGRGGRSA